MKLELNPGNEFEPPEITCVLPGGAVIHMYMTEGHDGPTVQIDTENYRDRLRIKVQEHMIYNGVPPTPER